MLEDSFAQLLCTEVEKLRGMPSDDKVCDLLGRLIVLRTAQANVELFNIDKSSDYERLIAQAQAGESCAMADGYPPHLLDDVAVPSDLVISYIKTHSKDFDLNFVFLLAGQAVTDNLIHSFENIRACKVPYPTDSVSLASIIDRYEDSVISIGISLTEEAKHHKFRVEKIYELTNMNSASQMDAFFYSLSKKRCK